MKLISACNVSERWRFSCWLQVTLNEQCCQINKVELSHVLMTGLYLQSKFAVLDHISIIPILERYRLFGQVVCFAVWRAIGDSHSTPMFPFVYHATQNTTISERTRIAFSDSIRWFSGYIQKETEKYLSHIQRTIKAVLFHLRDSRLTALWMRLFNQKLRGIIRSDFASFARVPPVHVI